MLAVEEQESSHAVVLGDAERLERLETLRDTYYHVLDILKPAGVTEERLLLGGGAVRDKMEGLEPYDYDFFIVPERTEVRGDVARRFGATSSQQVSRILRRLELVAEDKNVDVRVDRLIHRDRFQGSTLDKRSVRVRIGDLVIDDSQKLVQIMFYNYVRSFEELVSEFDIDICMYGYNPRRGLVQGAGSPTLRAFSEKMVGTKPLEVNEYVVDPYLTKSRLRRFERRYGCDVRESIKKLEVEIEKEALRASEGEVSEEVVTSYGRDVWEVKRRSPKDE